MAQETAVEWLVNELIFKGEYKYLPNSYFLMSDKDIDKIIIQAKAMEKEQIIDAFNDGDFMSCGSEKDAINYYNEKYNK